MSDVSQAKLRNIRITPRKARLVVDLVRGKPVQAAIDVLKVTNRKAAPVLVKIIKSAIANAKQSSTVDVDSLVISDAQVQEGKTWKRFIPRAQGRATPIRKRTSHITIKLKER